MTLARRPYRARGKISDEWRAVSEMEACAASIPTGGMRTRRLRDIGAFIIVKIVAGSIAGDLPAIGPSAATSEGAAALFGARTVPRRSMPRGAPRPPAKRGSSDFRSRTGPVMILTVDFQKTVPAFP
jgi:hypothetical protein